MRYLRLAIVVMAFGLAAMPGVADGYTVSTQVAFENATPGSTAIFLGNGAAVAVSPQGTSPGSASIGFFVSFAPESAGEVLPNLVYFSAHLPPQSAVNSAGGTVAGACFGYCGGVYYPDVNNKLLIQGSGFSASLGLAMALTSGSGSLLLGFGGVDQPDTYRPGPPGLPHIPDPHRERDYPMGQEPGSVAGGYLTSTAEVPVVAEHGYTDFLNIMSPATAPGTQSPGWSPGYFFSSSKTPFTHFVIPESLPHGDSEFKLIFGAYSSHTLQAGVPFDFTEFVPGGVTSFLLTGFDATEDLLSDAAFPYEHGFRFANQGATTIRHGVLLPGDYSLGGMVNDQDYLIWRSQFGSVGARSADGNQDGGVDAADYIVWRKWQALSTEDQSAAAALAGVPEPSTLFQLLFWGVVLRGVRRSPR